MNRKLFWPTLRLAAGVVGMLMSFNYTSTVARGEETPKGQKLIEHESVQVAGWTVLVDRSLRSGPRKEMGETALRLLDDKLFQLTLRLPEKRIEQLRSVRIWLDDRHELTSMQYHPSRLWLSDHGYDPQMEKSVHIPRAEGFVNHIKRNDQPWAILHELAHAYHDQFLGNDHSGIRKAYEDARNSGKLEQVLHINGKSVKHYALTNHKEFFAEMSEAYLWTNDFYPFVRGELRDSFPAVHSLLHSIWMTD